MATKIRGITIELGADATGVLDAIKEVNSKISTTSREIKDVDKLLKLDPTNMELLEQKTELLKKQISDTKEKLNALKEAQKTMDDNGVDRNSEQYQALQREIIATEQQLKDLESTAGSGSAALAKISAVTGEIGEKMEEAGKKMSIVSAAIAAIGTAAVAAFNEVDEGADIVIKKTGATGDEAEALEQTYKNVAEDIVADFEDIGAAVGEVSTRFGATGEELEDLSEEFLKFANINNMDVETAVTGVDQALKTFNVDQSEAGNVMGLLSKTAQDTGISVDEMLSLLQSSGPTLKEMGLDIDSAVTLMGNFESAGLDSGEMLGKLQKAAAYYNSEGLSMEEGLSDLIARLQDSDTAADATAEAYEIFGKRGGLAFVTAAQEGKLSLSDLEGSLSDYGTVVDDTYQQTLDGTDKMKLAWQNMQLGMADLGEVIGNVLAPIMDKVTEVIQDVTEWFGSLDEGTKETIVTIGLVVAAIGPLLLIGGKVLSGISSISSALSALGSSSFGPIGLVVAGCAALVGILSSVVTGLHDAWLEASPFTEELNNMKTANDDLKTAIDNAKTAYDNEVESSEASAGAAQVLYDKILELTGAYDGSAESQETIKTLVGELNELVPDLGLAWDETTNSLNLNTQEVYNQINAMKAQAQVAALQDFYTESLKEQYQAQKNLTDAYNTASEILAQYGLTVEEYQDLCLAASNGTISMTEVTGKFGSLLDSETTVRMEEATNAMLNYIDASHNNEAVTENVAYAEEQLGIAMEEAARAATNSCNAIEDRYQQVFGTSMPETLRQAINAAKEAGVKVPQNIVDGVMSGQISVHDAARQITEMLDTREEAEGVGEEVGEAYTEETATTIKKEGVAIGDAAETAMGELDQSDVAAEYGSSTADAYTGEASRKIIYSEEIGGAAESAVQGLDQGDAAYGYGDNVGTQYDSGFGATSGSISKTVDEIWDIYYQALGVTLKGKAWEWGYNAAGKLKSGLNDQMTSISSKAEEIVSAIETKMQQLKWKLQSYGYQGGTGLNSGLGNGLKNVYVTAYNAGGDAGRGFYEGWGAWRQSIYNQAYNIAANAAAAARDALDISSPSKVMQQIGEYTGEGFALGLEESADGVYSAMDSITGGLIGANTGINALNAGTMKQNSVSAQTQAGSAEMVNVAELLTQYLPYLAKMGNIVLDDGTLVGHMAPELNAEFARLKAAADRG